MLFDSPVESEMTSEILMERTKQIFNSPVTPGEKEQGVNAPEAQIPPSASTMEPIGEVSEIGEGDHEEFPLDRTFAHVINASWDTLTSPQISAASSTGLVGPAEDTDLGESRVLLAFMTPVEKPTGRKRNTKTGASHKALGI